ncbi:hypothetical protein D0T11_10735 [Hymenobacter rubripertinctus]|uniref:Uncharacterized protein n=1 Tax=Hymenobacter rubripertinctus TaxID=2029981 RepID=A0A418QXV2_9BACT|nr:hypothetical protein D0T11_10735 [Hymenobacter rubripertinctus]
MRLRAWFGLRQPELALYLGLSTIQVQGIETGRRRLTLPVTEALLPLLAHLPAPDADAAAPTAALPPDQPAPTPADLDFRRRVCQQRAARLRTQAARLSQQAHQAHRWALVLPALLAAPPDPDPERATWRTGWLRRQARPLSAAAVTRWHLLQAQAQALETEAAALTALLATALVEPFQAS